jgi:hypothetical protein
MEKYADSIKEKLAKDPFLATRLERQMNRFIKNL